jgi:hypothetical protein
MFTPPEEFVERLEREFGQKYRIRWSPTKNEWHLEQKVRRGLAEGFMDVNSFKNEKNRRNGQDDLIRLRDGYVLTMAIKPGTFTHCGECNTKFDVPAFDTKAVSCPFCMARGRHRYQVAGYFPLSDSLIDHLRKIDADRGGVERTSREVTHQNELLELSNYMDLRRRTDAGTRERFNRIAGILQTGYTGTDKYRHRTRY